MEQSGRELPYRTLTPREGNWLGWPVRHPWAAVAITAVLGLMAGGAILRLRPDASLEGLFPRDSASGAAVVRVLNDFAFAEDLLLLVSVPPETAGPVRGTRAEASRALLDFAGRLEMAIRSDPRLDAMAAGVVYRPDPEVRQFFEREVAPAGLYYLDDAAVAEVKRRLTPDAMRARMARNAAALAVPGPAAGAMTKVLLKDPLGLHEFLLERFQGARALAPAASEGSALPGDAAPPFLSPDGCSLLVRIPGRRPPSDLDFTKEFTAAVARTAESVNTDGLEVGYAGSYAIAAASERAIRSDAIASTATSFLYLGALFFLAYRFPLKLFALAFGPVVVGVLLGFGAYAVWSASITPMTAVLGAMLAEMGINYTVHYLSLYDTHRASGDGPAEAAAACSGEIALPLLAAWCTSVVGFVAVGFSSLRILRDFAVLGTLTLLGAVAITLLLLPAALVLVDRRPSNPRGGERAPPLTRQRFSLTPALRPLVQHARLFVPVSAVLFVAAAAVVAFPGERLPLETDLTVMHPRPNAALDTQAAIARRFGSAPQSLVVYLKSDGADALVRLAHDVDARLATDAARAGGVVGTFGLATLLPDPRTIAPRAAAFDAADAERIVADFRAAVADSPFDAAAYETYASFLRNFLTPRKAPTVDDLVRYPSLASLVLPRTAVEPADAFRTDPRAAVTLISLDRGIEQRIERLRTISAIRSALDGVPGATLTGMAVVSQDAESVVRRDLPRMLGIGAVAVIVYLLAHFRSPRDVTLVLLPTAFSVLCLMALVRLGGLRLNMVNLVAAPLLIGINVDYGIFLVSLARSATQRHATADELARDIGASCHAVLVCALTTILGFGSLVFMAIPAVRSLGVAVSIGVLASLLATVFFLAPLLIRGREVVREG